MKIRLAVLALVVGLTGFAGLAIIDVQPSQPFADQCRPWLGDC